MPKVVLRRFAPACIPAEDRRCRSGSVHRTGEVAAGKRETHLPSPLRTGLKAVLCSPDFLYMSAAPGRLDNYDLATRLSYFLWSTTPDDTLTDLAARGELGKADVLRQQVERMLGRCKGRMPSPRTSPANGSACATSRPTIPDKKNSIPNSTTISNCPLPLEAHLFLRRNPRPRSQPVGISRLRLGNAQ